MRPSLLLTRPRAQAERFAKSCRAQLGEAVPIVISPVLEIALLPAPAPEGALLIFSSENAVRAAAQSGITGARAYCVGDRTAEVARQAGFDARSASGTADDLIALIAADAPEAPLLYLHGKTTRVDVAAALRQRGMRAAAQVVYEQRPQALTAQARAALAGTAPLVLPLFSPRSAALLSDQAQAARAPLYPVALSAQVAQAWTASAAEMSTAAHPDSTSMIAAIAQVLSNALS